MKHMALGSNVWYLFSHLIIVPLSTTHIKHYKYQIKNIKEMEICKICGLEFGNKEILKGHYTLVHPAKMAENHDKILPKKPISINCSTKQVQTQNKCSLCKFQTKHKVNLKSHIERIHKEIKNYQCLLCDARYYERRSLKHHIQSVHEGKSHECTICNISLTTNRGLKKHIESVHEGKRPFRCDICDGRFSTKAGLKIHIKLVHESNKPTDDKNKAFQCANCPSSFARISGLRSHILRLHEEIQFKCDDCEASFAIEKDAASLTKVCFSTVGSGLSEMTPSRGFVVEFTVAVLGLLFTFSGGRITKHCSSFLAVSRPG